jgi:hypothetical protein
LDVQAGLLSTIELLVWAAMDLRAPRRDNPDR